MKLKNKVDTLFQVPDHIGLECQFKDFAGFVRAQHDYKVANDVKLTFNANQSVQLHTDNQKTIDDLRQTLQAVIQANLVKQELEYNECKDTLSNFVK